MATRRRHSTAGRTTRAHNEPPADMKSSTADAADVTQSTGGGGVWPQYTGFDADAVSGLDTLHEARVAGGGKWERGGMPMGPRLDSNEAVNRFQRSPGSILTELRWDPVAPIGFAGFPIPDSLVFSG